MSKPKNFFSILIPSTTVFISSFCIMVLELVAARLIAKHLGSSLYTWTAVIGVVLAGITIGNYLGGRIADRFQAKKALAVLFAISSAACVVTVILNNVVAEWMWLWHFSWLARTFTHVSLVFLLPSVLLGTISPVVAKMALDQGLATDRTVGDIYAWGAAGSIAGTFAAGYYLIASMGDFKAATEPFKKALALNPANPVYYDNLVKALEYQGRFDEAIEVLKKQIQLMKRYKQDEAVSQLQRYLEFLEFKKAKSKPR